MRTYGPMPLDINDVHSGQEKRRYVTKIIIHCSDSTWGDFKAIDNWHSQRKDKFGNPWRGVMFGGKRIVCGYHYIVLNGHVSSSSVYDAEKDGRVEKGRPDQFVGAHCRGQNLHSIGICLIGGTKKDEFTKKQFQGLSRLMWGLTTRYSNAVIYAHYDFSPKACPNFDVEAFAGKWKGGFWP